jgi:hypothetical protein
MTSATETLDAATLLDRLEAKRAALPDEQHLRDELERLLTHAAQIDGSIDAIRFPTRALASLNGQLVAPTQWFDFLTGARQTCCDELLACPSRDSRREANLKRSIQVIDRGLDAIADTGIALNDLRVGELMMAAAYREGPRYENQACGELPWAGSLPAVEQRLADLRARRDDEQARLDAALQAAARLVD